MIIFVGIFSPLILLFCAFCFGYFIYLVVMISMVLLVGYAIYRIFFAKQQHYKLSLNENLVKQIDEQQMVNKLANAIVRDKASVKSYKNGKFN